MCVCKDVAGKTLFGPPGPQVRRPGISAYAKIHSAPTRIQTAGDSGRCLN